MKNSEIKLLDCTLRDGGYYNNWQFKVNDANKYLKQIYDAGIDVVEVGFHFFEKNKNYGKFAYVNNSLLQQLIKSNKVKFAIMINGSDFFKIKGNYKKYLKEVFNKSIIRSSIIRIAAHYKDLNNLIKYIKFLKSLNFKICFNLMQINNVKESQLKKCLRTLKKTNSVDVFYFADSFGNLKPTDINIICKNIKKDWSKEIGIHSHDNCGLALKNSIQAYKNNVTWIDGTVQGMGRGAGNVKTEELLKYFKKYKYKNSSIKEISENFFLKLKKKYKWGKSNFYKVAAKHNIHPTYIQMLQADNRYTKKEIISSINSLKKIVATSYDPLKLENIFSKNKKIKGKWNAKDYFLNKDLLILGQGSSISVKKNIDKIKNFILHNKCVVVSINISNYVPDYLVDFYISSHETRISLDHQKYNFLKKPLIIPEVKLKEIKKDYNKVNYLDYGAVVKNDMFNYYNNYSVLPYNLTFAYAMAVGLVGKAKSITVAGFDGYKKNHIDQIEMEKTINLILKKNKKLNFSSLTKTNYPIKILSHHKY